MSICRSAEKVLVVFNNIFHHNVYRIGQEQLCIREGCFEELHFPVEA